MTGGKRTATLFIFALIIIAATVFAQQSNVRLRGSGGWEPGSRYESLFDNFNLRTFVGTVVRIDTTTLMRDQSVAMRLIVNLESGGEMPVHLGPMWYAVHQDANFPRGERLEIRGHQTSLDNSTFIMPVEIRTRNNHVFRFRDDDGNPFWSIRRQR